MEQFPQIVSGQLSEIVEDRIYPLVEHFMGFFGFGYVIIFLSDRSTKPIQPCTQP
jgi:hypothetical protein